VNDTAAIVRVENLSLVKKKLFFDIPWTDVKKELDSCYRDIGTKAKIKGFRPGKIPKKILESMYKDHAEEEVITNIINRYYWEAIRNNDIFPISHPEIHQEGIKQEGQFLFTAIVEVEPVIEPEGYIGLELEKEETSVTENEVEERLQQIRNVFGTVEEITEERSAGMGDVAVIDFVGTLDGEQLKEMTAENYHLEIGAGRITPEFENNVIGMLKGESKQIQLKFSDEYKIVPNIAGKEVSFSIELKSIKEKKLPALDENFIKNFNGYETLDALRTEVQKNLEEEKKTQSEASLHNSIIEKVLEINDFEVPPTLIERQLNYMLMNLRREMTSRGMNKDDIDNLTKNNMDTYRGEATKSVKAFLLLKSIAVKEAITVGTDVIDGRIKEMALQRGEDFDSLKKSLEDSEILENMKAELVNRKVFDFIEEKSTISPLRKTGV
jgi:trigger factor